MFSYFEILDYQMMCPTQCYQRRLLTTLPYQLPTLPTIHHTLVPLVIILTLPYTFTLTIYTCGYQLPFTDKIIYNPR